MAEMIEVASSGVGLLLKTVKASIEKINAIQDAPNTIKSLGKSLHEVELSLRLLQQPSNQVLLGQEGIDQVVQDWQVTCTSLHTKLASWTKHTSSDGTLAKRDRLVLGVFKKDSIQAFKSELTACKESISFMVNVSSTIATLQQGKQTNERLGGIKQAIESELESVGKRQISIDALVRVTKDKEVDSDDDDDDNGSGSEEDRASLLRQLEHQKATNEALRTLAAEAIPKFVQQQTGQQIAGNVMSKDYGLSCGNVAASSAGPLRQYTKDVSSERHGISFGNVLGGNFYNEALRASVYQSSGNPREVEIVDGGQGSLRRIR